MLLHIDAFEYDPQIFNANAEPSLGFGKVTYMHSGLTRVDGRRPSSKGFLFPAIVNSSIGGYTKVIDGTETDVIIGAAIKVLSDPSFISTALFHLVDDQESTFSTLEINSLGLMRYIVQGIVLGTTSIPLGYNVWNFIELRVRSSTSVGQVEVRVNGRVFLNLTNVNTRRFGGLYKAFGLGAQRQVRSNMSFVADDFYLLNTSAPANTTFLGDCRVDVLRPTAAGSQTQFTATPVGDNFDRVNEVDTDLNDRVTSTAAAQQDLYTYGNLPSLTTPTVFGIQVVSIANKTDSGSASIKNTIKSGASVYPGATEVLSVDAATYLTMYNQNPNGSVAWTETTVNAIEAGVESA